jgi:hypothetical protein
MTPSRLLSNRRRVLVPSPTSGSASQSMQPRPRSRSAAGLSAFASLDEVDVCVTDGGADWEVRGLLAEAVGELLVATVAEPEPAAMG